MFPGRSQIDDDALRILPYREIVVTNAIVGSGASQVIDAAAIPGHAIMGKGKVDIGVAFTVGGGDTTGLSCEFGTDADPNGLLLTANLVAASLGLQALGGDGALDGFGLDVAGPIPRLTLTPTGGSTELDHVDAGELIARVYYVAIPLDFAEFA